MSVNRKGLDEMLKNNAINRKIHEEELKRKEFEKVKEEKAKDEFFKKEKTYREG